MLLQMAVADAYAIPFEFVKSYEEHGLVNDLKTYKQHPRYKELRPSQFTDDTLRSVATARRVILHGHPAHVEPLFEPLTYLKAIQTAVRYDPRKGWSKRFQQLLEDNINTPTLLLSRKITKRAESNGSIMGCLPLGYLKNPHDIRMAATAQAIATHSVTTAPFAQALALAAHYFIYDLGAPRDLMQFLDTEAEGFYECFKQYPPETKWLKTPIDMTAEQTAFAVFRLLEDCHSLTEIMRKAVDMMGDTDSVAALAVGIASCSADYEEDLPQHLIDGLDEGEGKDFLTRIDLDLEELILRTAQQNVA